MHLEILNPDNVSKGIVKLIVDGKEIGGTLIPGNLPGTEHHIQAWMG